MERTTTTSANGLYHQAIALERLLGTSLGLRLRSRALVLLLLHPFNMTVYLGTHGEVELQREFDGGSLFSTIDTGDVNATKKRFSFDFDHGQLITGDQIVIN